MHNIFFNNKCIIFLCKAHIKYTWKWKKISVEILLIYYILYIFYGYFFVEQVKNLEMKIRNEDK